MFNTYFSTDLLWVKVYNTKSSYRNTKKSFIHTNLFITQNFFEHSIQNHYF
jgi:hypothetical protein